MQFFRNSKLRNSHAFILSLIVSGAVIASAAGQTAAAPPSPAAQQQSPAATDAKPAVTPPGKTPGLPSGLDPKTMAPLYTTIQEDWSSLDIGVSKLTPMPPLPAETAERDTFTRQLIQVQWRPGDPIDLYVILPKGVKHPPAVLYLYSFTEDTDRFKTDSWCARVTSGGVAAVGFVSALSGHRFHDRPMKQWFVSELQESLGSTVHDVKFILDYLASRGDVDMDRIGMFGQGSGGTIAILAAAADSRIKAVDALDPWGDWPDWLAKSSVVSEDPDHEQYVKPEFLKKVAPLDPVKWLPELKTTKIRIQQVAEWGNPIESQDKVKDAAPKQAVVERFATEVAIGRREGGGRLFDWIKTQLQAAPGKSTGAMNASATSVQPSSPN